MAVIPALIVPILSGQSLLTRMFGSIDHPIEQAVVVDNGDVVHGHEGFMSAKVDHLSVISLPHNIGVAASWNLGIQVTPLADSHLIVNHDIEFGPGDLERMATAVDPRGAGLWMFSNDLGMAAFAITRHTLNAVGFFDAGIHPAYNEDLDFVRRVELAGLPRYEVGWTGKHVGSATINSDPLYRSHNDQTHGLNDRYYARKWGGPKHGGETFSTPFNRGGHLGEWRLDIETLRGQAWRRR